MLPFGSVQCTLNLLCVKDSYVPLILASMNNAYCIWCAFTHDGPVHINNIIRPVQKWSHDRILVTATWSLHG